MWRYRQLGGGFEERHPFAGGPTYYAVFFEDPDRCFRLEVVAPREA